MFNHPEWKKENSLTTPDDRDINLKWKPNQEKIELTENEVEEAMNELNNISFTSKFPKIDRTYADPFLSTQNIGLISFTPAKGASPNSNGVFGFAKLRGNFASEEEANQRAEFLIRNVDSYHQIYHTYVGRPFPITASSKYSLEKKEIDIRKEITESISSDIKQKKIDDSQTLQEIKKREEALIEDTQKNEIDPYDEYITLSVKKAQLSWTYLEHIKKIREIKEIISKTRIQINNLETNNPDFKLKYYEKYMNARKESGFKDSKEEMETTFLKYLVEDVNLPGIDEDLIITI
jgi:hypothetical protein